MDIKKVFLLVALLVLIFSIVNTVTIFTITGKIVQGTVSLDIVAPPQLNAQCGNLTTAYGRWNYVSTPVNLQNSAIRTALSSIDGGYDWVFEYAAAVGEWDYYFYSFDTGSLTTIVGTNCYLIKALQNSTLIFNGVNEIDSITKNLTTNNGRWNYLGWVNDTVPINEALSSIAGKYDWVFRYDATLGEWDYYFANFATGTLSEFNPCECYIIKATANVSLNYSKN